MKAQLDIYAAVTQKLLNETGPEIVSPHPLADAPCQHTFFCMEAIDKR